MITKQRHTLFSRLQSKNPHPTIELNYTTPFELLIAVILSAQATDKGVNKATPALFKVANTPSAILALGEEGLKEYIKTIGLFNTKCRNILKTCHQLIELHEGEVPGERSALEALPGVGRKTANVILNTIFGEPTIAVDTHIFRVANRTSLAPGKTVRQVEDILLRCVPKKYKKEAHHWLVLHGRYICIARKPKCEECVIADLCEFPDKTTGVQSFSFGKGPTGVQSFSFGKGPKAEALDSNLSTLRLRADLYKKLRKFFAEREVLEVETPILSAGCVPDPHIEPFRTDYHGPNPKSLFLHTSPELPMKRLLAAGSGAIFQISKVFRDGEAGRWHNPEFSLLEWYRPGFNQDDLIQEVDILLQYILHCAPAEHLSYRKVFKQKTGLHPLASSLTALQDYANQFGIPEVEHLDRDTCLQLIFSHHIEPQLGKSCPIVIKDFPASQAALARKKADDPQWAERFEIYIQGIELANGFYELTEPVEQRQRFEEDLAKRQARNLPTHPLDERFLAALEAGLPDCAGVALGLDRLLMLITEASHINEVLTFSIDCA